MADEYTFDEFDDGSGRQVGVFHQEKMRLFLEEYSKQLRNIEEALHESLSDVWDPTMDPVALVVQPYEQASLKDLINTENKLFNKIILVFASLCKEMDYLSDIAEKKFLPTFLLFGQELSQDPTEGDAQIQIGRMMPFLIDLSNYVNRVYSVVMNTVRQVATLYEKSQELYKTSFKDVHLNTLYNKLGSMLTVLITLDEVIMQNIAFRKAWLMYKRMTKDIKAEAGRFNTDEEQMLQFEKLLLSIEGQLLEGAIYENCIQQEFDFPGVINVRNNELFEKELLFNVKAIYQRLTSGDLKEIYQRSHYIGLCSLFVFYFVLFRKPADKKFFKAVWDLQQIIPVIHLCGNVVWLPNEFLTKKVAFMVKAAIGKPDTKRFLTEYVANMDRTFINEVNQLYLRTSMWMVRMESNLMNRAEPRNILVARISLINSGIRHAHEIGDLFKQYIYLHSYLGLPLKPSRIRYLCQCVEMLKAIQGTFHPRSAVIGETMSYMIQEISFQLQRTFFPIKDKLEKAKSKYNEQRMDILAAANLCMRMLLGCSTDDRRLVLRLAMHVLFQVSVITDAQIEEIKEKVRDLDNICDLQNIIAKACDCSFFYWSRIMLPTYFSDIFKNAEHAQRLPYMFAGLRDISNIFSRAIHLPSAELHQMFVKDVESSFQQSFMKPLCTEIETDLRFHIHSHLEVQERNPFQNGVRDLSALVAIRPIRFFDQIIDIKNDVGNYLDRKFYDLTTVALYDWKTYAEMRNLAHEKYGISMKEVHLPGQTLEQGVDVLEIMRNIHIFVARYHYNINNQIFIEKQSDSKILNTVNIGHIANSLRTHGAGIMNTTVNFTYQFLRQKFKIFSQFLFDEHIKSRLYKDARFFRENKDQLESRYPFDRAEKFNKEIRKLGLTPNGLTYLDQFRLLITEIGNAMGYIRLVRSGGLQYISNSIKFIPDIQDPPKFSEMTGGLSAPSVVAAQNLDKTVDNLIKNFSTGTDYFKMLVSVIAPEFRNEQNMHLRNFYIIVPPLILNFVDHMLISKEKLKTKKGNQPLSFCFSDDGFSIGLAYILKLLNQYLEFDTLHWFDSVTFRFEAEIERITNQIKAAAPPPAAKGAKPPPKKGPATPSVPSLSEEQQTMLLTKQKSKNFLHEFELFRFSFAGARIFFKD